MAADQETVSRFLLLLAFQTHTCIYSGPAKDSLKILQSRLQDVETCLLKVLSTISDSDLSKALEKSASDFMVSEDLGSRYPMDTTSAVRSWQQVRTTHETDQGKDPDSPLDPTDVDGASPKYHIDTACDTENVRSAWQIASTPFEQDLATSYASRTPQYLSSDRGTHEVAEGDDARQSHSSNPQARHPTITDDPSTRIHDTQHHHLSSTLYQSSSVASDFSDLACLPFSQQASLPVQSGVTDFPEHLFW